MRTSIRTLVLTAGLMAPATALAQPVATDLGTLAMDGTPIDVSAFNVPIGQVAWFKVQVPVSVRYQDLRWLDVFNPTQTTIPDTEIALYGPTGDRLAFDDDDGPGVGSQLTFGTGEGTIPAGTTPTCSNGRDGDLLAAGTYWIAVSHFSVAYGPTNWTITTNSTTAVNGVILRVNGGSTPAVTDPVGTINLGTVSYGTPVTNSAGALSSSQRVQWYKVNLPEGNAATGSYVDMDTEGTALTPSNTTRLTLFTAAGAQASNSVGTMTDLVDGSNSLSQLTFGTTSPARPAFGNGLAYNGRDGAIRAGRYYVNVMGVGSTPTTTSSTLSVNFGLNSTSTNYGPVTLRINAAQPPTNPAGTGTSNPIFGSEGDSTTLRVTVTPGLHPTSTGLGVSVDASSINAGTVTLLDDGVAPDVTAGDNVFSGSATVGIGTTTGAKTLPFTITDDQARTATGNISFAVVGPPPACPSGGVENLSATGLPSDGPAGAPENGVASFAPASSALIGSFKINGRFVPNNAFTAEARVRVTAPGGQQFVVQPFTTSGPSGVPVDMVEQTVTINCPIAANSGAWEIRTFESFNDAGIDGVWANLCVALVEAAPADPAVWTDDACVADAGDLPGTAQVISGCGPLNSIRGNFAASDIDMYRLRISNPAAFSATTAPGTADTQIFLFGLDGKGILFNDDTSSGSNHSTLTNAGGQITTAGDYYLAVGIYNRDPVDSANALLWLNSPFTGNRIPDGPGAANPINGWVNTTTTTGPYTITLAGTSKVSPAGCNRADVSEIGGTSENPGCPDGQLTVDDIIVFVNTFSDSLGCPGANAPNGPACNLADITDIGDTGFGPDAQLTVDDIIAFFNSFSDGCL